MNLYKHQEQALKDINKSISLKDLNQLSDILSDMSTNYWPLNSEIIDIDYEDLGELNNEKPI